jgi:ankyrin repeat protein
MTDVTFSFRFENDEERLINDINIGQIHANTKENGIPLLSMAIGMNKVNIAKTLIENGANVNTYTTKPSIHVGMAPIHFANTAEVVILPKCTECTVLQGGDG